MAHKPITTEYITQLINQVINQAVLEKITYDEMQPTLICSKCGSQMVAVIDGRVSPDGVFKRRRKCLNCDARYNTYEITERDYEELARVKGLTHAKGE